MGPLRVAVVEDEASDRKALAEYLQRSCREAMVPLSLHEYDSGEAFLFSFEEEKWDVIFLDIQMKRLDGMETARRIRERDERVLIIFLTALLQYAYQSYEVDAFDFILKPLDPVRLERKFRRVLEEAKAREEVVLRLPWEGGWKQVSSGDIFYIEVMDHRLVVHTRQGTASFSGSLREMEEKLQGACFAKCSQSYLVNLRRVEALEGEMVLVGESWLKVSRRERKAFLQLLAGISGR